MLHIIWLEFILSQPKVFSLAIVAHCPSTALDPTHLSSLSLIRVPLIPPRSLSLILIIITIIIHCNFIHSLLHCPRTGQRLVSSQSDTRVLDNDRVSLLWEGNTIPRYHLPTMKLLEKFVLLLFNQCSLRLPLIAFNSPPLTDLCYHVPVIASNSQTAEPSQALLATNRSLSVIGAVS